MGGSKLPFSILIQRLVSRRLFIKFFFFPIREGGDYLLIIYLIFFLGLLGKSIFFFSLLILDRIFFDQKFDNWKEVEEKRNGRKMKKRSLDFEEGAAGGGGQGEGSRKKKKNVKTFFFFFPLWNWGLSWIKFRHAL